MTALEKANRYQEQNRIDGSQKPVFHMAPPVGWMNDPNGFSLYQKKIHLFYQYHPYSHAWGPMHWGHYVSEDFIKWEELPPVLAPDMKYDGFGCFSGSAIETEEGHALVYTGVEERKNEDGTKEVIQQQCLAIGDGVTYQKERNNPVIPSELLPEGLSKEDFRDPKIWREDGVYYLVAGSRDQKRNGKIVLFESQDLRNWKFLSILADNQGKYGAMWECPDFFPMGEKHILIASPMDMRADGQEFHNGNQAIALIGEYNKKEYRLLEEQVVSLDYGMDFYAPQTMEAEDGRRIMVAWLHSWDTNDIKPVEQKWNGMMTIPREIELRGGRLYQNPVRELKSYYMDSVVYRETEISGKMQLPGIWGRVLDLTLELLDGDFETFAIYFAANKSYSTSFRYQPGRQSIEFDRTYSGIVRDVVCQRTMKVKAAQKTLKLRLVLDRFSVELFVNDGAQTFTAAFYTPLEADEIWLECDKAARVHIEKHEIGLEGCNKK